MYGQRYFAARFTIGEVIPSGGPRSRLRLLEIGETGLVVAPVRSDKGSTFKLPFDEINAVIAGFHRIDSKRIQPTIQEIYVDAGFSENYWTENYQYGFAREFLARGELFLDSGEEFVETFREGGIVRVAVTLVERDPRARAACIAHFGYKCLACDFDFSEKYGVLGNQFIHIHHLTLLSTREGEHTADPVRDLVPVCANCHAMLHRQTPPLTISELREIMERIKSPRPEEAAF